MLDFIKSLHLKYSQGEKIMDINNPLYKNQGIHVILSLFTVEEIICFCLKVG